MTKKESDIALKQHDVNFMYEAPPGYVARELQLAYAVVCVCGRATCPSEVAAHL